MESFDIDSFLLLLRVRPKMLLDMQIIYKGKTVRILDISVSGDYIFIERVTSVNAWVLASSLENPVIVDSLNDTSPAVKFTIKSISTLFDSLNNRIGQPGSEQTKCLFEIVETLNKEVLELKFKIEEIQSKE